MGKSRQYTMQKTGQRGAYERYRMVPAGVGSSSQVNDISAEYGADSLANFKYPDDIEKAYLKIGSKEYEYVYFGHDDQLPYMLRDKLLGSLITAQCVSFNVLACYGRGVRFIDRETKEDTKDLDIRKFCLANSLHEVFLEQSTDMKMFCFSVTAIMLSRDGKKIVRVRNLDASYCRFEYAQSTKSGTIEHVFYGDFREGYRNESKIKAIPLLDYWDPLGDLNVRMGRERDPETGQMRTPTNDRVFAILCRIPTPGFLYYPVPYYTSIFRDAWYDIYRLIGIGKRHMIKNTSAPRTQIEVHADYWDAVCDNENIHDENARAVRKELEKQNIIDFITGVENAGKALVSGYYVDPNGKETRMVRIYNLSDASKKEGGNWSDDMVEASNALCFAFGIHPNLVGATPGKSQMNNSGSDKRELFTLKQSLEAPYHDVMCKPYHVILHYNGWAEKVTVDVPMILLTTLDQNTDAKQVSVNNSKSNNNNTEEDGSEH